jgi:hypothetical protein
MRMGGMLGCGCGWISRMGRMDIQMVRGRMSGIRYLVNPTLRTHSITEDIWLAYGPYYLCLINAIYI